MTIKDGDLVIPIRGADGELVAVPVVTASKDADLIIPVLCADGVKAAVKAVTMQKDGDIGIPGLCADGEWAGLIFAAIQFWTRSHNGAYGMRGISYDATTGMGILYNVGLAAQPLALRLHSSDALKIISVVKEMTGYTTSTRVTNPCAEYGYFYVLSGDSSGALTITAVDEEGTQIFQVTLSAWAYEWNLHTSSIITGGSPAFTWSELVGETRYRYLILFTGGYAASKWHSVRKVINANTGALVSEDSLLQDDGAWQTRSAAGSTGNWWVFLRHYNPATYKYEIWRGLYSKDGTIQALAKWLDTPTYGTWQDVYVRDCGDYIIAAVIKLYGAAYTTYYYRFDKSDGANQTILTYVEHATGVPPYRMCWGNSQKMYMLQVTSTYLKLYALDLSTGAITEVTDGGNYWMLGLWNGKGLVATGFGSFSNPSNENEDASHAPFDLRFLDLTTGELE